MLRWLALVVMGAATRLARATRPTFQSLAFVQFEVDAGKDKYVQHEK